MRNRVIIMVIIGVPPRLGPTLGRILYIQLYSSTAYFYYIDTLICNRNCTVSFDHARVMVEGQRPRNHKYFFWLMLRAQIGQCAVFKTPTKLQHPYCNSFEAIAIGKLDLVLDRRNVSLFRDLATEPIFTPRISQPLNSTPELPAAGEDCLYFHSI